MAEVGKMKALGVEPKELVKVRNRVKASKIFEKQSMDGMAKSLGFWELQGGHEKESAFLKALDNVSSEDVSRVCDKYLRPKRATLVLYRPESEKPTLSAAQWQEKLQARLDGTVTSVAPRKKVATELRRLPLKGGGTLLVKERHDLPVVSMGAFFLGGFPDEKPGQYGLTTLMSKCLLKGSGGMNNAQYAEAVEALAARIDPVAEKDYWGLTLDTLSPQFDEALGLLGQALTRPLFDKDEVAKERELQQALIRRLSDDPGEYALQKSDVLTFAGTPYAHTPLGEEKDVAGFNAAKASKWFKSRAGRRRLTVVVVGDVDVAALKGRLESVLADLPQGPAPEKIKAVSPRLAPKEERETLDRKQATLVLGLRAPRFDSKVYFTFRVMSALLNGMGARLFVELREKRSLAYSVFASHEALARSGVFQAYVGCAPGKEIEARRELLRVLRSLAETDVTDAELHRAKTYITGLYKVGLQANRSQMGSIARYELSGPGAEWVGKYPEEISKVSKKDIREAAKSVFVTDSATWVVLGPDKK